MKHSESGLFIAHNFNFLRQFGRAKGTERVITDARTGERMRWWRDDSRTVVQIERDDRLDGFARPDPIRFVLNNRSSTGRSARAATPHPIRTGLRQKGTR